MDIKCFKNKSFNLEKYLNNKKKGSNIILNKLKIIKLVSEILKELMNFKLNDA